MKLRSKKQIESNQQIWNIKSWYRYVPFAKIWHSRWDRNFPINDLSISHIVRINLFFEATLSILADAGRGNEGIPSRRARNDEDVRVLKF